MSIIQELKQHIDDYERLQRVCERQREELERVNAWLSVALERCGGKIQCEPAKLNAFRQRPLGMVFGSSELEVFPE